MHVAGAVAHQTVAARGYNGSQCAGLEFRDASHRRGAIGRRGLPRGLCGEGGTGADQDPVAEISQRRPRLKRATNREKYFRHVSKGGWPFLQCA